MKTQTETGQQGHVLSMRHAFMQPGERKKHRSADLKMCLPGKVDWQGVMGLGAGPWQPRMGILANSPAFACRNRMDYFSLQPVLVPAGFRIPQVWERKGPCWLCPLICLRHPGGAPPATVAPVCY